MMRDQDLIQLWPIVALVVTVLLVQLSAMFLSRSGRWEMLPWIAVCGVAIALIATLYKAGESVFRPVLLGNTYLFDGLTVFATSTLCIVMILTFILGQSWGRDERTDWGMLLSMVLLSGLGLILLASTRNLLMLFLGMEMSAIASYVLVGFERGDLQRAARTSRFVFFSAVCSALTLFGITWLIGVGGRLDLGEITIALRREGLGLGAWAGLAGLFAGIGLRAGLFPLYFRHPDALQTSRGEVSAWLAAAPPVAALVVLVRFVHIISARVPGSEDSVLTVLTLIATVTMTLANLAACVQPNVKRILAYAFSGQLGAILCGFFGFYFGFKSTAIGETIIICGRVTAIACGLIVYVLTAFGLMAAVGAVERAAGGSDLVHFRRLSRRNPSLAALTTLLLFSVVGLPPLAGYSAKLLVINDLHRVHLDALAVVIIVNAVISLVYCFRIFKTMYFGSTELGSVKTNGLTLFLIELCLAGLVLTFAEWKEFEGLVLRMAMGIRL